MYEALTGIGLYALTWFINWIAKKFGATIDKGWIIAILSFIVGVMYYALQSYYPDALQQAMEFLAGAFGVSQGIWLLVNNLLVTRKDTLME